MVDPDLVDPGIGDISDPQISNRSKEILSEATDPLKDLLAKSVEHLSLTETLLKLADLLSEYQEVFAKSEFELGNFTALEHEIDTVDSPS